MPENEPCMNADDLYDHTQEESNGKKRNEFLFVLLLIAPEYEQERQQDGKPGRPLKKRRILRPVYADESAYVKQDNDPRGYFVPMG